LTGFFQQALWQIPGAMDDALDTEGAAIPVEQQMTVKRLADLDAANVGKLRCGEVARPAQVWFSCHGKDRFMHGDQISLSGFFVRIFQIPAVLQGHVLLGPGGDGDGQAHA